MTHRSTTTDARIPAQWRKKLCTLHECLRPILMLSISPSFVNGIPVRLHEPNYMEIINRTVRCMSMSGSAFSCTCFTSHMARPSTILH